MMTSGPPNVDYKSSVMRPGCAFAVKFFLPFVHREENGRLGWFVSLAAWPLTTRLGTFLSGERRVASGEWREKKGRDQADAQRLGWWRQKSARTKGIVPKSVQKPDVGWVERSVTHQRA